MSWLFFPTWTRQVNQNSLIYSYHFIPLCLSLFYPPIPTSPYPQHRPRHTKSVINATKPPAIIPIANPAFFPVLSVAQ